MNALKNCSIEIRLIALIGLAALPRLAILARTCLGRR